MEEGYVKESKTEDITELERDKDLIKSLIKSKKELQIATKNFEQADEELIDYYTYQIKAIQSKMDYLVKNAKKRRLFLNAIDAASFGREEVG